MVSKQLLQSVISKYYLNGIIESVKWNITDNVLKIEFMSPSQDMLGHILVNNFNLPNSDIAIFDTTKLSKLLGILSNNLYLDFIYSKKIITRLIVNDGVYNLEYPLADLLVIPKVAQVDIPEYEIIADINTDLPFLVKAQNALNDNTHVYLKLDEELGGDSLIEVMFGENHSYSNKISYKIKNIKKIDNKLMTTPLLFDANLFKEILKCNGNSTESNIYMSLQGLMCLEFKEGDITSTYFLAKKDDI